MANIFFPNEVGGLTIPPGSMITPHTHPNSIEIVRCESGRGQAHLISDDLSAGPADFAATNQMIKNFEAGDLIFIPRGFIHFFLNLTSTSTQPEDLVLFPSFDSPQPDTITINAGLSEIPDNILNAALRADITQLIVPFGPPVQQNRI